MGCSKSKPTSAVLNPSAKIFDVDDIPDQSSIKVTSLPELNPNTLSIVHDNDINVNVDFRRFDDVHHACSLDMYDIKMSMDGNFGIYTDYAEFKGQEQQRSSAKITSKKGDNTVIYVTKLPRDKFREVLDEVYGNPDVQQQVDMFQTQLNSLFQTKVIKLPQVKTIVNIDFTTIN